MELNKTDMATIVAALELLKDTNERALPKNINQLATMNGKTNLKTKKEIDQLIQAVREQSGLPDKDYDYHFDSGIARGRDAGAMMFNALGDFLSEDGVCDLQGENKAAETFIFGFVMGLFEDFDDGDFELTKKEIFSSIRVAYGALMMGLQEEEGAKKGGEDKESTDVCTLRGKKLDEEFSEFFKESMGINGRKERVIFDVRIVLDESNDLWVGFLTPDEFALTHKDLCATDLQQDYIHWFESHLAKVTKYLSKNKVEFKFFSEIALENASELVERENSYLEISPHEFDSDDAPKQCVGLLISNGEISICTILMFLTMDGDLVYQKNLFSLHLLKAKGDRNLSQAADKIIDEAGAISKEEGCQFIGLRATNELVFCEDHRAITANVIALVSEEDLPQTPSTLLH